MTEPRTVALVGLPLTGKSTYMGAFWQLVQDPAEQAVVERDFTGDRSYLQRLGGQVARAERIDRTEVGSAEAMRLGLTFDGHGDADVDVPDLSGETVRLLVEDRLWHPHLEAVLDRSEAALVFVHADDIDIPFSIAMANDLLKELDEGREAREVEGSPPPDASSNTEIEIPEFARHDACTAAKCVDALENVVEFKRGQWPLRLGIVISAWDAAAVIAGVTPRAWLRANLPGVSAFLSANSDILQTQIFGVSAQGGRLPEDRAQLLEHSTVRERAFAHSADGAAVSLVEPVRWALWG